MRHDLSITLFLLAACGSGEQPAASAPTAPAAPSAPVAPRMPSVDAWTTAAPPGPWVIVARDAISLGDDAPVVRLSGARVATSDLGGPASLLIQPLHDRLVSAPTPSHPVGLAIDPEVPFRTVTEVVYTLALAEREELALLVRREGAVAALPLAMPRTTPSVVAAQTEAEQLLLGALGSEGAFADVLADGATTEDPPAEASPAPAPSEPRAAPPAVLEGDSSLNLTLLVTRNGLRISGSGGWLAPGCEHTAPSGQVTVPVQDGAHDLPALARCLERVHREFPSEQRAIVTADPETLFRDVASVIAVSRGTAERPLFPLTILSIGAR